MVRGVDIWCWQPYLTPATHPRPLLGGRTDPQYWFLSRERCFLGLGGSVWADSFCNESEISCIKFRHPTRGIPVQKMFNPSQGGTDTYFRSLLSPGRLDQPKNNSEKLQIIHSHPINLSNHVRPSIIEEITNRKNGHHGFWMWEQKVLMCEPIWEMGTKTGGLFIQTSKIKMSV